MGKSSRNDLYKKYNYPGPGTYDNKSSIRSPKYNFGGRHSSSSPNLIPGPGQYTPDYKLRQASTAFKITFGGRPGSASSPNLIPGPGQYTPDYKLRQASTAFKITFGGRPGSASTSSNPPGPGTYEIISNKSKKGGKFGSDTRHPLSLIKNVPGPGTYNRQIISASVIASPRYRYK